MRSKNRVITTTHESQLHSEEALSLFVLKFLTSLKRQPVKKSGIYSYPVVFKLLSALFSLNKQESWLFLKELQAAGLIKLIPAHGVRILVEVENNGRKAEGKN